MKEFYVWTKDKPYYRGPVELEPALDMASECAYIPDKQKRLIKQEYIDGTRYNWNFVYGFNELAHITVNPK